MLNSQFLYEAYGSSLKLCGIFHFRFRLVFIELYIFVQRKAWTLTLKRHNSFQNKNNKKAPTLLCS